MKLILLGDMAFFGKCSLENNPNIKEYFAEVAERISQADYVVGNLETPFSINKKINGAKSAYICSNIQNVEILKLLHVNAVTLANNHIFDYGKEGYEVTKRILTENSISFFGCEGKNLDVDIMDNKLRFEGFCCYSSNPLQTVKYGDYGVNEYNVKHVDELLTKSEEEGRLCVSVIHAGLEHINYPSLEHIKAARWLATRHNMIYCGHHPHVAQGIEVVKKSLIAYSLGNFCFDDVWTSASTDKPLVELSENNRSSFILEVEIEDNDVKGYDVIPIYISKEYLLVGKGVTKDDIDTYTQKINSINPAEYETMRKEILSKRYKSRKAQRDLNWYIKRMRLRYIQLFIDGRRNLNLYKRNIRIDDI